MIASGQLDGFDESSGTTEEVAHLLRAKADEFGIPVAQLAREIDEDSYEGFDSEVVDSVMAAVVEEMKAKPGPAPAKPTQPTPPDSQDDVVDAEVLEILGLLNTPTPAATGANPIDPGDVELAAGMFESKLDQWDDAQRIAWLNKFASSNAVSATELLRAVQQQDNLGEGVAEALAALEARHAANVGTQPKTAIDQAMFTLAEGAAYQVERQFEFDTTVNLDALSKAIYGEASHAGVSPADVGAEMVKSNLPEVREAAQRLQPVTFHSPAGYSADVVDATPAPDPTTAHLDSNNQLPIGTVTDPTAKRGSRENPMWFNQDDEDAWRRAGSAITDQDRANWDPRGLDAMHNYTSSSSGMMNRYLWDGNNPYLSNSPTALDIQALDAVFDDDDVVTPFDRHTVLTRGASAREMGVGSSASYNEMKAQVGKTLDTPAYLSTSITNHPEFDGHVRYVYIVAPGVRGLYVDGDGINRAPTSLPGEREVILQRGIQRKVISVRESMSPGHQYDVIMEVTL
ncbi:ADP-ribosyltransferase [Gordonia phage Morgana]|uniref:ADP-ribosyltransferase n=1 Tax=Gordonia phage Morgana TaxID=3137292 RepID=A0AAX4RCQ7_9CAUD